MLPRRLRLLRWYRGQLRPGETSPLQILMIQATSFCNINCSYCYLPHRDLKGQFDLALLEPLFDKLIKSGLLGNQLTIVWHAGEPFVLPLEYYKQAFNLIAAKTDGQARVTHSFQTNAMRLTPEYCDFLAASNAQVGVSIDGPESLHDAYRRTRSGDGTHARTLQGIAYLKASGIGFTTISVITERSLSQPDETFSFLSQLGAREIGFNLEEIEGINTDSSLRSEAFAAQYRRFMKRIFELALSTPGAPRVRELAQALSAVQASVFGGSISSSENNPFSILSVSTDGRLATYSPELLDESHPTFGDFSFGTIRDVDFEKVFHDPKFTTFEEQIQTGIENCRATCGYFNMCGGGAPANKLAENGRFDSAETAFCRARVQIPVDIIEDLFLDRIAANRAQRRSSGGHIPNLGTQDEDGSA